ncbi:hypothetical protein ACHAW6_003494 [Cyclotella cf. meneghiniana]
MDTLVYEVHFPHLHTKELDTNAIAEALYAQCDSDGNQCMMLDVIIDYQKNPNVAVSCNNQVKVVDGKKVVSHSFLSWELCCEWKVGSTTWQKLSDLKEALATGIADEPAFNWWVTWVLKKRDQIISLVKRGSARYHKQTHKFGIEFPKTVDEAYTINKATDTTFWHDATEMEMKNVCVAFDILADGLVPPLDHQCMRCHMFFIVKMDQLVAGGHMTKAPGTLTYASIMSRKTMRIVLLVAALNDVDIWVADVLSACITAPCRKKIWTTLGREFDDNRGRKALIDQELYKLKSIGATFGCTWSGVCTRWGPAHALLTLSCGSRNRQTRGELFLCLYPLLFKDLLVVHHNPKCVMDKIDSFLSLKPGSIGPLEIYLGTKLKKKTLTITESLKVCPTGCHECRDIP